MKTMNNNEKVISISDYETISNPEEIALPGRKPHNEDINNNQGGVEDMKTNDYVSKDLLDAKLETVNSKIDSINQHIDDEFDKIPTIIENSLFKEREYQREQQKENRRFFWGTIIIGGISAIAAVVSAIVSSLQ